MLDFFPFNRTNGVICEKMKANRKYLTVFSPTAKDLKRFVNEEFQIFIFILLFQLFLHYECLCVD